MRKMKVSQQFQSSFAAFAPALAGRFVCPLCLKSYALDDVKGATEAHIVPESGGGRERTYLCKKCNSDSTKQDRWLGEYLTMRKQGRDILDGEAIRRLQIGDTSVGGTMQRTPDGMSVLLYANRSAPSAIVDVLAQAKTNRLSSISVSPPILRKQKYIPIGVLGAGYLSFFKAFGYAWAFQSHLNVVRNQLLNPDTKVLPSQYCAKASHGPHNLSIGLADFDGELALFALLGDNVVFYPPAGVADFYERLPGNYRDDPPKLHPFRGSPMIDSHNIGLAIGTTILIWPDEVPGGSGELSLLYAESPDRDLQILRRPTEEQVHLLESDLHGLQRVKLTTPRRGA